ncbi:MAG: TIGR04283 family arsenosugar biosynthesis glycosyltransferase [Geobacteraceae bacterium]|nr:TIGR04283 family arsenosugar biosynthesis glycosyltransferase [Geobacteraceae bacterium]
MSAISVIIPVLQEQPRINDVISRVFQQAPGCEVIVVDGNPAGTTLSVITDTRVIRMAAPEGRGRQLSAAAEIAVGEVLLMLHADTLLPGNAISSIRDAVSCTADWGAFRLGIDDQSLGFRIIERTVDLRCKLFRLPYGDQAIFVTRKALNKAGGIPAIPIMEDVELALCLNRSGMRFRLLDERVSTSARRWRKDGILRRTLRNWWLLLRYLSGADPDDLAGEYR